MEIVSELLGHYNVNFTQTDYGKIVQKKVSKLMQSDYIYIKKKMVKKENLSDEEIIQLYSSDISQYYSLTSNDRDSLIWDDEFLKTYWQYFSKFLELNNYKLNGISIPRDNETSFSNIILVNITFSECTFLDYFSFTDFNAKKVEISNCLFKKNLTFQNCKIDSLEIKSIIIGELLSFNIVEFRSLLIEKGLFFQGVKILQTKIFDSFTFDSLSINSSLEFENLTLNTKKESLIKDIKRIDEALLNFEDYLVILKFYQDYKIDFASREGNDFFEFMFVPNMESKEFFKFIETNYLKEKYTLKKEYIQTVLKNYLLFYYAFDTKPGIIFRDCLIMNVLTFYSINLKNFQFGNSNIEKIKFLNCEWEIANRLILVEESIKYGDQAEIQYRQLKRIFNIEENWYMSSLAYFSEMEMKKRKLGYYLDDNKSKYFSGFGLEYLIFQFYSFFGNYNQNYTRPLTIYLISTILFFPILYMFIEINGFNVFSYPESLEKSISNSLPFISTNLVYRSWSLKFFQILFSTIMLTFTILGLRKRFKQ
jgi:hypothetical protein